MKDAMWQGMLEAHFASVFEHLHTRRPSTNLIATNPRKAYMALWQTQASAFDLKAKARLALEVPELKSWVRCRKDFILKRQTKLLADMVGMSKEAQIIHDDMAESATELLALQELAGQGQQPALQIWVKEHWGEVRKDVITRKAEDTYTQRRAWFQQQRQFLLEDLSFTG